MLDREKVTSEAQEAIGMLNQIDEPTPWCDFIRVAFENTLALLKNSGQDEGWFCEKQTSGRQTTDLLCACGNKVYFTTLLFKDGFTANELYCPNCGLSMRSPHYDKDGVWLRKNWEEVVLKAQKPHVMTLEEVKQHNNQDGCVWFEQPTYNADAAFVLKEDDLTQVISPYILGEPINHGYWSNSNYGKTWRCWTSRPTDEQREATPWE